MIREKTIFFLLVFGFSNVVILNAQEYLVKWDNSIGTITDEDVHDILTTSDSSLLFAASTRFSDTSRYSDYYIIKTDLQGNVFWEKTFGGNNFDFLSSVIETEDNGFLLGGYSRSTSGDVSNNIGAFDYWIIKLDRTGNLEWEKSYGGSNYDVLRALAKNQDGYLLVGSSASKDADLTVNHGKSDGWVVQIDNSGNIIWENSYGGTENDMFNSVLVREDGTLLFSGTTRSNDGMVSRHLGQRDVWVVHTTSKGDLLWEKTFGGSEDDTGSTNGLKKSKDNNYIIVGSSSSTDFDLDQNCGVVDGWVFKFDNNGNVIWSYSYGHEYGDSFSDFYEKSNSTLLLLGSRATLLDPFSNTNYWLITMNTNNGTIQNEQMFGGSADDVGVKIISSHNNEFILAGNSNSKNGDISNKIGKVDIWLVCLKENRTNISGLVDEKSLVFPNPTSGKIIIEDFPSTYLDMEIFDEIGQKVLSERIYRNEIDLSRFPNGLYFISLQNKKRKLSQFHTILIQK